MLKKSNIKLFGIIICTILFCVSYVGISWYAIPEQVNAVTWFPEEGPVSIPDNYTIKDIKYLQEMNKTVCDNSAIGDTNTVLDIRDDNDYTIGKLADGKCWMTQNLRITRESIQAKDPGNTTGKVTPDNTNTNSNYEIPASATGEFSDTKDDNGFYINQQVRAATDNDYGAYYSYNVVTLNKVATQNSGTTVYDICPKGWRLPTGGDSGEFRALALIYPAGSFLGTNAIGWTTNGINGKAGRWIGGANAATNGAFFPAAGYMFSGSSTPSLLGLYGHWWSSTISNTSYAKSLNYTSSSIDPNGGYARFNGISVRCVANENILESENLSGLTTSSSGSIAVKVANTLSIDAVSGMEEEVDNTSVANGTITATIAANTNYKVLLSAEKTSLTSANSANDAAIPASPNVAAGTNAWGIRNVDNTTYSAITNQEKEYYHTTTPSTNPAIPGTVHTFNIGISVSPSLPADTYSTEVTITAAAV